MLFFIDVYGIGIMLLLVFLIAINAYDLYFRMSYTKQLQDYQKKEQDKMEEMFKSQQADNEELDELMKREQFAEMGMKSGEVRAEKALQKRLGTDMLQSPEVQVALELAKEKFPSMYQFVIDKPHMIPRVLEIMKKYQGSGGLPQRTPMMVASTPANGRM